MVSFTIRRDLESSSAWTDVYRMRSLGLLACLEGCRWWNAEYRRIVFRRLRVAFCCILDPLDPSRGSPIVSFAISSTATGLSSLHFRRRGSTGAVSHCGVLRFSSHGPSAAHTFDDDHALPVLRIACCSISQAGCRTSSLIPFDFAERVSVSHPLRLGPSSVPLPRPQLHGMLVLPQVVHH
ncbi:hypothetical protein C8F01DRAFT_1183690 [Mycena amicta]|nr:hypothetical protein C8F01DRAFT_1183690 [Mycena amicta]